MTNPPSTPFTKLKWATSEVREYIVVLTATFVIVRETGVLDEYFPQENPDVATPSAAELAPAVEKLDKAGQVVIDPIILNRITDTKIGSAVALECPFPDGCVVQTMPPVARAGQPNAKKTSKRQARPTDTVGPEPDVEFVEPPPDYGAAIIIGVVIIAILATMLFKRLRSRWRIRNQETET